MGAPLFTAGITDRGRTRKRNEDAFIADPELGLAVVADGMGGHPAEDVASALATSTVREHLSGRSRQPSSAPPHPGSPSALGESLVAAVRAADALVRSDAAQNYARAGMGSTVTALLVRPDEARMAIGHLGDSRAYLYVGGRLRQLTRDHTWVQEQVDARTLPPAQAWSHPWGHVLTQALGVGEDTQPQLVQDEARPGHIYLLCTDGLTSMLPDRDLERVLEEMIPKGLDSCARALVGAANQRGGADNITVVLLEVGDAVALPGDAERDATQAA